MRVVQGKEPEHFCALFKGKLIVHDGGRASGFNNSEQKDEIDDDGISLFHVRGTNATNTHAVQVKEVAASLNSGDCFVLVTPSTVYSWNGSGSNDSERAVALTTSESLTMWNNNVEKPRTVTTVNEGEEDDAFWEALGGKGEYPSEPYLQSQPKEPRLFEISNITGTVKVDEVMNFSQDDLLDDDVMMLDTYTTVFVWIGQQANETEKKAGMELAQKYVTSASEVDGRDVNTNIIRINAGSEPAMFTCNFLGWDAEAAAVFEDPYEKRMKSLSSTMSFSKKPSWAKNKKADVEVPETVKEDTTTGETKEAAPSAPVAATPAPAATPTASSSGPYTLEQLKGNPCQVHDNIDPKKKETYLSDDEFKNVFGMDRGAFNGLAAWKQKKAKMSAGLF